MNDPYYMQQIKCRKKADEFSHPPFFAFYLLHRYALVLSAASLCTYSNSHRYHRSPKYKRRVSHKQLEAFQS